MCVGGGDFFFSRISGCCSLYFQWDVLSSLWAKGFFVDLSCSYFTFFQFHICFQFWAFLEMVIKIILYFLFLVYLTIFRSFNCRLKYILGYRYSYKYTTKKANIRYKVASLIYIMISVLVAVYQYHSEQRVWNLLTSFLAFTCTGS